MNKMWGTRGFDFLRTRSLLTALGSETHDTILVQFIPMMVLDDAKTDEVKTTDNDTHQQFNTKQKHNRQRKIFTTYQVATSRGAPCKHISQSKNRLFPRL